MKILVSLLIIQTFIISLLAPSLAIIPRQPLHPYKQPLHYNNATYETNYFTQNLDHFDYTPESNKTFQQRYLINTKDWGGAKNGFPIFVYIGHQDDIKFIAGNTGFMFEISKVFQSAVVFIEHRYYGESIPFGGKEVAYTNASTLGYLNTRQALADVATLVIDLKKNLTAMKSPVVVFGGAYGGVLSAWFRLKYPHIAIGALSSSAPILDFDSGVSPYSFTDIITKNIRNESENCYKVIKKSWSELENILDSNDGIEKLAEAFNLCKPLPSKELFQDRLFGFLELAFIYASLSDYPEETNIHTHLPAYPVKKMCEAIDNPVSGNDTLARLFDAVSIYYNYTGDFPCFNLNYGGNGTHGINAWKWQACTELVEPSIQNSAESIFPSHYKHHHRDLDLNCNELNVSSRPHWITTEYGGQEIKKVLKRFGSNIIFFNGLRDPVSAGGILESISKTIVSIVAPHGAHNVDLLFSEENDPKWLENVKEREAWIIERWIEQYYEDHDEA